MAWLGWCFVLAERLFYIILLFPVLFYFYFQPISFHGSYIVYMCRQHVHLLVGSTRGQLGVVGSMSKVGNSWALS